MSRGDHPVGLAETPAYKNEAGERLAIDVLKESKDYLFSRFSAGDIKETFQEEYSEIIDQFFRTSIQESEIGHELFKKKIPFALIAVGGYGRKELCLFSDIDILILFKKKIPYQAKTLTEELFYPLWDLGLELGYGVRTIKDCINLSRDDFEVLTSMMDARFLCGDSILYLNLVEELQEKVIKKKSLLFTRWLDNLDEIRMREFGDASHLLEPNLKEGIGGLRDYHHILWIAKAFFKIRDLKELEYLGKLSHREHVELRENVRFILFVRNQLHQLSGRKNDRLSFEYQENIANRLGYKTMEKIPAVEQFLGKLHAHMESIKNLHRFFLSSHKQGRLTDEHLEAKEISQGIQLFHKEVGFRSATAILANPFILMDIFEQSSLSGCSLSMDGRRLVKEFLHLIDDRFRKSQKTVGSFLNILNGPNTVKTLDQMFETGFLDAFIPEFGKIKDRVQFDAYHIFPVGRHILETVFQLKNLAKGKEIFLLDISSDLSDHEILFLGGLFHDIGKTGKGHTRRGVKITKEILNRFDYPKESTEEVLFLIENHLFLTETATRRDLNDEKVIINCARKIGTIDRLKALYLLTWADSKATGPRAWNDWIANLVQELFFKILHILEMGELATPDSSQKVKNVKKKLRHLTAQYIEKTEFDRLFEIMSPRYKLNTDPTSIVHHMEMLTRLEEDIIGNGHPMSFILDVKENKHGGFWEVTFVSKDRPGLFSNIAGVMALNNINILSSNIYTWTDGTVVDIFSVTRPLDFINPHETWGKIDKDLKDTFSGKLALSYRLSRKAVPSILSNPGGPIRPPEVNIDNKSSDFFTLIEVFAADRVGLLYLITRTLFDLHLNIHIAKTGVRGDQIADIFYVRDLEGQKLEDQEQVDEVKRALIFQLSQK